MLVEQQQVQLTHQQVVQHVQVLEYIHGQEVLKDVRYQHVVLIIIKVERHAMHVQVEQQQVQIIHLQVVHHVQIQQEYIHGVVDVQ